MENKINYEFLIMEYLKSYNLYYGKEETLKLMTKIIDKEPIRFLEKNLDEIGVEKLSYSLSNILLRDINKKNMFNNINLTTDLNCSIHEIMPLVIKSINNRIKQQEPIEKTKSKIRKKLAYTTGIALIGLGLILANKNSKDEESSYEYERYYTDNTLYDEYDGFTEEECNAILKENVEAYLADKKIVEPSSKIDTIKDILDNQRYFESKYKDEEDKLYSECKLSAPIQQFIYKLSNINKIPADFTFTIIHTETRGEFNSSGIKSDTNDLGLTQQNKNTYVELFAKKYNISFDEAEKLVKNNDYANLVCCFMAYDEIRKRKPEFDPIEYAGCYNGWLNWREKGISKEYVKLFNDVYDNIYTDYHDINKNYETSNKIKIKN